MSRPATAFVLPDGYSLRALAESDASELHALIERNHARLAEWMHWAQEQTPAETLAFIERSRTDVAEGGQLQRAVIFAGAIVGMVGIAPFDLVNRSAGVGYWLDREHLGHGVITAAAAMIVAYAFEHWQLKRLEIRADVENRASRGVAERLGFQFEGVARQSYRVLGERFSDDAVYSMLDSDPARAALP